MPKDYLIRDFTQGWTPSDDRVNGRKNGLLHMDSVELDQNGALVLQGGSNRIGSPFAVAAHKIFSARLHGVLYNYNAGTNGKLYRDNTELTSSAAVQPTGPYPHVYLQAYNMIMMFYGEHRLADYYSSGIQNRKLGVLNASSSIGLADAGAGAIGAGTYTYKQVNVYYATDWQAFSNPAGDNSITIAASHNITVTPVNDSGTAGSNIQEVWIYRKGPSTNGLYYRVKFQAPGAGSFTDSMTDAAAIAQGIILNENLTSVRFNSDIVIYAAIGPIAGRILYVFRDLTGGGHSQIQLAFSEVDNPENFDISLARAIADDDAEPFLNIKQVSDSTVVIATTKDLYVATGSFLLQPDGFMDVYIRPMGVSIPPTTHEMDVYQNSIVMMTVQGWCITSLNGQQEFLAGINTDRLYRGEDVNGYFGAKVTSDFFTTQSLHFCTIAQNKLVTIVQAFKDTSHIAILPRMEIYDFNRKSWRHVTLDTAVADSTSVRYPLITNPDGHVILFDPVDLYFKRLFYPYHKKLNSSGGSNQNIDILTSVFDLDLPRNRKDFFAIKFKINTGGSNVALNAYLNDSTSPTSLGNINSNGLSEVIIDVTSLIGVAKSIQFSFIGTPAEFILDDISISFDERPEALLSYIMSRFDFGPADGMIKTIVSWPMVLNTINGTVTVTPLVDGIPDISNQDTYSSADLVLTYVHKFRTFTFNKDFGIKLTSSTPFEFYKLGNPLIAYALPLERYIDQFGPKEHFKYFKVKRFELRVYSSTSQSLDVTFFFDDAQEYTATLPVDGTLEKIYWLSVPKTTAGNLLKVKLDGAFFFCRVYARAQGVKSDYGTDMEWVDLEDKT